MSTYSETVLADNPISYWRLGEPSGTVASDEQGVNDGSYQNTPTLGVAGLLTGDSDTAVQFASASNEYVVAKATGIVCALTNASFECWFKTSTNADDAFYGEVSPSTNEIWSVEIRGDDAGQIKFAHRDAAGTLTVLEWGSGYNDNVRHHLVLTKTGTSVRCYIDGSLVGSPGTLNGTDNLNSALTPSWIAANDYGGGAGWYEGALDEVAVYNTALGAGWIGEHWAIGSGGTSLLVLYPSDTLYPEDAGLFPMYAGELAPTVTTTAASDVSYFSATLNGTVDPNGLQTEFWFEYGLTAAYGSSTIAVSVGNGTSPVSVDYLLTGLTDNTTYHYRLVARNGQGTTYGEDGTLTTLDALVPVVVTGAATDITAASATLNGTVDPEGQATYAWFEYGLTTAYGSQTGVQSVGSGTSPVAVSALIWGLVFWRLYYYRLVATSAAGTTYGNVVTFRTLMSSESTGVLRVPE